MFWGFSLNYNKSLNIISQGWWWMRRRWVRRRRSWKYHILSKKEWLIIILTVIMGSLTPNLYEKILGSFHAKWTTFQKSWQVTPSDFAHIHTVCSSIGRMNTQKKSAANSLRFWKYRSSKIRPDPPFLASAHRVIDLSDLWSAFIPVCNKIQKSKLLPGVIFTHIFKIWSQKHDILFSFLC